ncbi:MAG TPA: hypothetical protein VFS43_45960 [Polyangiaceae bacterium]|nr:hypothetical protein [Polyangiaceae bacterium]
MPARSRQGRGSLALLALVALGCGPGADAARTQAKPEAPAAEAPSAAPAEGSAEPAAPSPPAPPRPAGTTRVLRPASAPFAAHPEVLVHLPEGLRPDRPLALVVFLHGWFGCVDVVAGDAWAPCRPGVGPPRAAMGVVGAFERARVNALLVVPQLAFDAPSSDGGRLERKGGLRALVAELLADDELGRALGRGRSPDDFARVLLFAHSGAYDPLGALLAQGGLEAHEVHLLDALYQVPTSLERWARASSKSLASGGKPARRLSVVYTDREKTGPRSVAFFHDILSPLTPARRGAFALESASGATPAEVELARPFVLLRTMATHEDVPRVFLGPLLRSAGLVELPP